MSSQPHHPSTSCVMCGGEAATRLCSTVCQHAAVREREANVRRFRHLRRGGAGVIGDALCRRNAELTEALLEAAMAPRSTPVAGTDAHRGAQVAT